jgi:hypothetical protein
VAKKVKAGRNRLVVAGIIVPGMLAAATAAASGAGAAATPLSVGFGQCGGGSAGWNSALEPVLTSGTALPGGCRTNPLGPADNPAFSWMAITSAARLAAPTTEPTFTASTSGTGPSPRMVIDLANGEALAGYPGLALAGQSGPDAAGMAWAVGDSTTYTDYQTAYNTAAASSATVLQAFIEADGGTATTVTSVQYGGRSLGAGTVAVTVLAGPQTVTIGSAAPLLRIKPSTTSSDTNGLTVRATGLPDGLTLNPDNTITGTPAPDAHSGTATLTATDAYGQTGTAMIAYTVNSAPAPVPVLSHGKAVATTPTRETVTWQQTVPSWEKFTIVGPGAINGHVGWVPPGTEIGYYSGLEAHHGYTVTYTPYTAKGGSPIPGANPGTVYFVS